MQSIPSTVVCNYFYFFFIAYAVLAVVTVLGMIGVLAFLKMPKAMMIASGFQGLLVLALAGTTALFHYLICDRALLSAASASAKPQKKVAAGPRASPSLNPDMMS